MIYNERGSAPYHLHPATSDNEHPWDYFDIQLNNGNPAVR